MRKRQDQRYQSPAGANVNKKGGKFEDDDDLEAACRSLEKYLVEMMVEEGKVRELADVEELLLCWSNLTSPVFVELVSRFYRDLCNDLFSAAGANDDDDEEEQFIVS
ncbi:transcription repressor OFP17-like [Zingiber officinale]|uniref:transcription repressor OFP17-like n=1 Tax=Zingiber officinale TaxID=94328 RepID=UPI001C4B27B6|nr:transcription repressor OFP17-like [Zingiber officinale]